MTFDFLSFVLGLVLGGVVGGVIVGLKMATLLYGPRDDREPWDVE